MTLNKKPITINQIRTERISTILKSTKIGWNSPQRTIKPTKAVVSPPIKDVVINNLTQLRLVTFFSPIHKVNYLYDCINQDIKNPGITDFKGIIIADFLHPKIKDGYVKGAFLMKAKNILLLLLSIVFLSSCSSSQGGGGGQVDYEQTKKMVVDILKTDDGKKAIQDVMSDDKMKEKLVMDQKVVAETIQQTLTSEKGTEFWKKTFSDPKFAEGVAKNMKTENEKLLKDLMKDPEYRGMMIEVFKEPEIQKEVADSLKSKDYREHLQKVITETMESPLFKAKMQEMLIKGAEEMQKGKSSGKESKSGGESSQSGQSGQGGSQSGG